MVHKKETALARIRGEDAGHGTQRPGSRPTFPSKCAPALRVAPTHDRIASRTARRELDAWSRPDTRAGRPSASPRKLDTRTRRAHRGERDPTSSSQKPFEALPICGDDRAV